MKAIRTSGIRGMTIVELMIALGLFSLVATTATSIFVQILRTSRMVTARSTAIDNLSLVIEQIAREIRTGRDFSESVSGDPTITVKELKFTNYLGNKVTYRFNDVSHRLEKNGDPITPDNLKVDGNFVVTNFMNQTTPRILVTAVARDSRGMILARAQTTVGARLIYYKP